MPNLYVGDVIRFDQRPTYHQNNNYSINIILHLSSYNNNFPSQKRITVHTARIFHITLFNSLFSHVK